MAYRSAWSSGRALLQPLRQRFSLQILHHEVVNAVLLSNVMERADVRMIQTGDRSGLPFESLLEIGVVGQMGRQNLDGHGAVEAGVLGFINFTHPTGSDERENLVGSEFAAGGEGHGDTLRTEDGCILNRLLEGVQTRLNRSPNLKDRKIDTRSEFGASTSSQ